MFMWNFTTHPLAPGLAPSHASDPAGTEPSPIQMHTSGSIYSVMFPNPGFYPFYCTVHQASGMVGVIRVL
jgi:plastocyanin